MALRPLLDSFMAVRTSLSVVVVLTLAGILSACGSSGRSDAPSAAADPISALRNPEGHTTGRTRAVGDLWRQVEAGEIERESARRTLKDVAWLTTTPEEVRLAALRTLMDDPQGEDDSRRLARLMLPRGAGSHEVAGLLASTAADRGWTEVTPAIVRSYSEFDVSVPDDKRVEKAALMRLHPGQSLEQIAYRVFLNPMSEPGPDARLYEARTRADAWDLLARLDPTGQTRAALILDQPSTTVSDSTRPVLEALRAGLRDLRVVPITGEELSWLASAHAKESAWWNESVAAVRMTHADAQRLSFRHIEPIRVASVQYREWLGASREQLASIASQRFAGRNIIERRGERSGRGRQFGERFENWLPVLGWGDLLMLLILDEAVSDQYVLGEIARQAELDRADTTTEYGGLLEVARGGGFDAVFFPPRPTQRINDMTFVASQDMMDASNRALAHYHLHANRVNNREYAGPSLGDLQYAARTGRTCVVFTTVGRGLINADVYTPEGVVIDLGVFNTP